MKQGLFFKAWRDHLAHKAYQMKASVGTLRVCEVNRQLLRLQCFNALRLHKQRSKLELLEEALHTDMNVALRDDVSFLNKTSRELEARYKK